MMKRQGTATVHHSVLGIALLHNVHMEDGAPRLRCVESGLIHYRLRSTVNIVTDQWMWIDKSSSDCGVFNELLQSSELVNL